MRYRIVWLLLVAMLLFGTAMIAAAQEDAPSAESPQENACYTGGSLEGKCDWPTDAEDEWAWACGWYIARFENGVVPASGVPEWCDYFSVPTDPETPPAPVCYDSSDGGRPDFLLTGAVGMLDNVTFYETFDGTCGGLPSVLGTLIEAIDQTDADNQCEALYAPGYVGGNLVTDFLYLNAAPDWYGCLPSGV